ncbi:phosphatidate cytidylyltransferase [Dethiobacter alkaliphilus]|uniref:Phosphatidate cytidylyltransferase n=1 Tax=Dethiobacter alkaliphilus AHT 1 TaxID=555088 RepID=C0GIU9_DETAL|nr:phosphatidate cytidylyltransferase [Dethiobacter alkaliphilus]EEG76763.1 phosphatidate cytidylyltransferase [Dethiobacter alkaliphilus AHT 1]
MFRQRLASALVGIPVVIAVSYLGGLLYVALITLVGLLALREYYTLTAIDDKGSMILGFGGHVLLTALLWLQGFTAFSAGFFAIFVFINIFWVLTYPRDFRILSFLLWGFVYVTGLMGFFVLLRELNTGFSAVLTVFVAVWASDTGAYLVGMSVGRHKLIPAVSPKKSVEGALGGMLATGLILALLAPQLGLVRLPALILGLTLSVAGQLGDLAESALKRWANIKDSGSFLPGHGGVLDRIDSLLFAAPLAYLFF